MIRIVIAEDQRMLRGALGTLLDYEEDMEVIGQAADGEEALRMIELYQPDICLLDIEMPVITGLEVAEALRSTGSPCKAVILTTFARPGYFERAMKAGVHGYLLKEESVEELAKALRRITAGERMYAPELIFNAYRTENPLTERETEVLALSRLGKTSREISKELFLSAGTVRNYMSDILAKLDAKNKVEAIRKAEDNGWI